MSLEIMPENDLGEVRFLQRQSRLGMANREQTLTVHQTLGDHGYTAIQLWDNPEVVADDGDPNQHVGVFPDDLGDLILALIAAHDAVSTLTFDEVRKEWEYVKGHATFNEVHFAMCDP